MKTLTWDEVLKMVLVGRDLEIQEGEFVFRGPIASIQKGINNIEIKTKWTAKLTKDGWKLLEKNGNCLIPTDMRWSTPYYFEGTIHFSIPYIGTAIIFPTGSNVDEREVEGLLEQK
ncbi:hypothetical protein GYA37_01655 [candidate division WWE3 bacterium]|uniref:Uncharacterized protein n=1 Tax=candidate division WWE3 bacterium TaxID=2053526 RepID=A0A7X9HSP6_UNCKA|nr:hypothetical protein [candidate division WWE3 bacterium]